MNDRNAQTPQSQWFTWFTWFTWCAWLACFAVLTHFGTWAPFAPIGVLLVALGLRRDSLRESELRPTLGNLCLGVLAGVLMVLLTHLAYAEAAELVPGVRSGTTRLLLLLKVTGFSTAAEVSLIVIIASCEEFLFRGATLGPGAITRPVDRSARAQPLIRILALASIYALTTAPLASPLLVLCAMICGSIWGALRVTTRSLVVPILAHVIWDLGVLIVWPLAA